VLIVERVGDGARGRLAGWISSFCPFAKKKEDGFFARVAAVAACVFTSLAWKKFESLSLGDISPDLELGANAAGRSKGEGHAFPLSTTALRGLWFEPPLNRPKLLFERVEPTASCAGVCFAVIGVVVGVPLGVFGALSMRDFLDVDLGVTLLSIDLAAVERSSTGDHRLLGVETSERGDLAESKGLVVVALRCWAAKRGVIGDLTARLEASVGTKGRVGGLFVFRVLFLSSGIVAC
jgi:hypothetical protein